MAKASALPLLTIANDSAWSAKDYKFVGDVEFHRQFAAWSFRWWYLLVTTTVLPPRSRLSDRCFRALHHHLGAPDENRRREADALLAIEIVGRRSAFEIGLAGNHGLDPFGVTCTHLMASSRPSRARDPLTIALQSSIQ